VRDLSAQYRQALLGFGWSLLLPVANTLTWVLIGQSGVVSVAPTAIPYPIYVFTGTMLWAVLLEAMTAPLQHTIAAKPMLTKVNFPREAIIVSGVYQTAFNAAIKLVLLLCVPLVVGTLSWQLVLLPLGVASLIVVGTTVGLLLTPLGLLYTDVGRALPLMMQFLMYLSPVVFPIPRDGAMSLVVAANPLTPLIVTTRQWLTGTPTDLLPEFLVVNAVAVGMLLIVWAAYRLAMPIVIERMSA
jgi:lipopolysaccharide transport system permease protein